MIILDKSHQLDSIDPMLPFALDELLCKQAAQNNISICHIWRHPNAFILGQKDGRLPHAREAMEWLRSIDYLPIVRNSGGAAVPLDAGVVNISLIFPLPQGNAAHFHDDFEKMFQLIAAALSFTGEEVHKGEIAGAYCPGDYDLSINGFKFCGIAQRRQLRAYCVQAFVIASGSGKQRTSLVRQFYERAGSGAEQGSYPLVTEQSTASLAELTSLGEQASSRFIQAIKRTIASRQVTALNAMPGNEPESDIYLPHTQSLILPDEAQVVAMAEQLKQRYDNN